MSHDELGIFHNVVSVNKSCILLCKLNYCKFIYHRAGRYDGITVIPQYVEGITVIPQYVNSSIVIPKLFLLYNFIVIDIGAI